MKKTLKYLLLLVYAIVMLTPNTILAAEDDYKYGVVNSIYHIRGEFAVWIGDNDGEEMCFARTILKVNGEMVTLSDEDALSELLSGKMVQYTVNADGYLESINYDTDVETVLGARYDAETGKFDCVDEVLPVYRYRVNDFGDIGIDPIYLDEHHSYDIEVSDYGINIVDFEAIGAESTIKELYVDSITNSDLTKCIWVEIDSVASEDTTTLKGELYDSESKLVKELTGTYEDEWGEIEFSELVNETETYIIKLWLENDAGEKTSLVYTVEYKMETNIKYGIISGVFVNTGDVYPSVRFLDATGYGEKYLTTIKTKINGESIEYVSYDYAEQLNTLLRGKYVQYVVQSGELQFINYDTDDMITYTGATYDVETGKFGCVDKVLPVYYCETDEWGYMDIKPVYLDENHRYTIETCDYGINIVDLEAIGKDETIKEIYIGDILTNDFKKSIIVEVYSTATGGKIKGELYDEKQSLVATTSNTALNNYIEFSNLPNEKKAYTIKLWLENDMGEKTSHEYTKTYETKAADIKYGIVGSIFIKVGDGYPSVRMVDVAGDSETYLMMADTKVNGEHVSNDADTLNTLLQNKYVQYAVQNGELHFINYDNKTSFISGSVDSQTGELSAALHNNYDETKTGVLIIATYAGGRLEKATSQPMSVAPLSSADISETVELTSKTDEVKLFFWDSLTNIQSYGKTISVDVK